MLKEFGFLSDGDLIEVKPSDLKGIAQGEAASMTAAFLEKAKGKVLFIDEAYGLDPTRRTNGYGGEVIDTLVEKLDRNGGSDIAVILAGYTPQMKELFKNASNSGFASRFSIDEAFEFEDFADEDLKSVLLALIRSEELVVYEDTVRAVISLISQRRRLDGFANAAEASLMLNRAKIKLANRKQVSFETGRHCDPYVLLTEDFIGEETSCQKAKDALADLENVEHVMEYIEQLEDTLSQAKSEGKSAAAILDDCHLIFTGPPGIYLLT